MALHSKTIQRKMFQHEELEKLQQTTKNVLQEVFSDLDINLSVLDLLKSGEVMGQLCNMLAPNAVNIQKKQQNFVFMANLQQVRKFLLDRKVQEDQIFDPQDVIRPKIQDFTLSQMCLVTLSLCSELGYPKKRDDLFADDLVQILEPVASVDSAAPVPEVAIVSPHELPKSTLNITDVQPMQISTAPPFNSQISTDELAEAYFNVKKQTSNNFVHLNRLNAQIEEMGSKIEAKQAVLDDLRDNTSFLREDFVNQFKTEIKIIENEQKIFTGFSLSMNAFLIGVVAAKVFELLVKRNASKFM
ncbi:Rab-like_protein [Hexamita inflata]|uniref:Rab-like protein n=1 Tax=Hexamita inflata TaxID=28002 RepID=A0AA86PG25_9EUKA|nr:Rab-like protein [Hexamita inflata]CAI9937732.1 Rab-like protein [Hexamita inflata]